MDQTDRAAFLRDNALERAPGDRRATAIVYRGKRYELAPLDLGDGGDYELCERYYLANLKDDLQAVDDAMERLAKYPVLKDLIVGRLWQALLKKQHTDRPPRQIVGEWLDSSDGVAFSLYLQLSRTCPEEFPDPRAPGFQLRGMDLSKVHGMIREVSLAEAIRLRDQSTPTAELIAGKG